MSDASLTFGVDQVFDFTEDSPVPASGYRIQALTDSSFTFGDPEAVIASTWTNFNAEPIRAR
ncbi:hypothetical protein [Nocardioides sp. Iso805N]|uniref:hypothetical protein n=1 Tax=Nocardioides sp. Iso805N TaxID=1283287 RepID=UPI00036E0CDE|nr:hypothetical protein [Nocardioides sp. Iso805N]